MIWGSFERNTGTWTPYSAAENAAIEDAFARGDPSIELQTCFNAVLHFNRSGGHHHQTTPAVGSKPAGYRSVLRGTPGMMATLYWWDEGSTRMWRLECPNEPGHEQQVEIYAMEQTASDPEYIWQWCDLVGSDVARAVEMNWHAYAPEHGEQIEAAWRADRDLQLDIGLTHYQLGPWQGTYGSQRNLTTNVSRQVRRGRFAVAATTPEAYRDDSCACFEVIAFCMPMAIASMAGANLIVLSSSFHPPALVAAQPMKRKMPTIMSTMLARRTGRSDTLLNFLGALRPVTSRPLSSEPKTNAQN